MDESAAEIAELWRDYKEGGTADARERLSRDLELAREVQRGFLPLRLPVIVARLPAPRYRVRWT